MGRECPQGVNYVYQCRGLCHLNLAISFHSQAKLTLVMKNMLEIQFQDQSGAKVNRESEMRRQFC